MKRVSVWILSGLCLSAVPLCYFDLLGDTPVVHARPSTGNAVARPDHKLTPGVTDPAVTQENIQSTICVVGYTFRVRSVSESTKLAVFEEYGIDPKLGRNYEVDHLISLENGGSNDIRNLWPQPYSPKPGAREKDVLETFLKRQVCAGKIALAEDQKDLQNDWYAAYLKYGLGKK